MHALAWTIDSLAWTRVDTIYALVWTRVSTIHALADEGGYYPCIGHSWLSRAWLMRRPCTYS